MKTRSILMLGITLWVACAVHAADDPFIGTWKINNAKSKQANVPKSQINRFEAMPNGVKFMLDAEDQSGKKIHLEDATYFDGKYYPVGGDSTSDQISRKRIDDHHMLSIRKKGGKIVSCRMSSVSKDGKTYTTRLTDANGKPVDEYFQVFDRQ
jgi:hypothetical protein